MIKKLGNAFKKMAQRNMLRGNRDAANAISDHGIYGMRANFSANNSNNNNNSTSSASTNLKNITTTKHDVKEKENTNKDLGNSILGALGSDQQ